MESYLTPVRPLRSIQYIPAVAVLALAPLAAQSVVPGQPALSAAAPGVRVVATASLPELLTQAKDSLDREDPLAALATYRQVLDLAPRSRLGHRGMAATYLFLGRPAIAKTHIEKTRRLDPTDQVALALHVRILIREGSFDLALRMSKRGLRRFVKPHVRLLAAHASALFRVQRTVDAAGVYQRVIELDPDCAEAHLRLGSGLLPPRQLPYVHEITRGIRAQREGRLGAAIGHYAAALLESPGHAVAHRLLGEALFAKAFERSMTRQSASYRALSGALPVPKVDHLPLAKFIPAYARLSSKRKAVAARALALFGSRLKKLVVMRGRHDLLREDERTTDADVRSELRGQKTFDGRVWDDVRGMGGLRAATGIEALDEAQQFGFDTLAHEIAHQAHLFTFNPLLRARIKKLYREAKKHDRCLDFYAASNHAEYFGQGVEAFVSLAKRPGGEKTHGHTRFELRRRDPKLYALIEEVVEVDPLRSAEGRQKLLPLAVETALLSGRFEDAEDAARMMAAGSERQRLLAATERARTRAAGE